MKRLVAALLESVGEEVSQLESLIWMSRASTSLLESSSETVKKPDHLKEVMSEVSLRKDRDGYFVTTHRARSRSYSSPDMIPKSVIKRIASTG